jgi:hypothetical protein
MERPSFRGVVTSISSDIALRFSMERPPFRGVVTSVGHCLQGCAEMERPHFRGVVKTIRLGWFLPGWILRPRSRGGYNLSVGGASVITDAETPACGGPYGDRPHDRETKLGIFYAIYGEVLPVGRSPAQTCCPAIWEAWIFRSVGGSDLAGNRR